jgi:hypothetical protein
VTVERLLQFLKHLPENTSTDEGIQIDRSAEQPEKAAAPKQEM